MYTSPHEHKILIMKLAVCNHYQQVTVFCITGASTNSATPRLYSVKELLQRYEIKMTYAIPGVEKGTQSSTLSPVLGLHSRSLEQIMSNHLRRISKVKFCAEGGTRTLTPFQVPHFECGASTIPPLPLVPLLEVRGLPPNCF